MSTPLEHKLLENSKSLILSGLYLKKEEGLDCSVNQSTNISCRPLIIARTVFAARTMAVKNDDIF